MEYYNVISICYGQQQATHLSSKMLIFQMGWYSSHYKYIIPYCETLCFEPKCKLLVVVVGTLFYLHLMHCHENWCGLGSNFKSIIDLWGLWFKIVGIQIVDDGTSHQYSNYVRGFCFNLQPMPITCCLSYLTYHILRTWSLYEILWAMHMPFKLW